MPSRTCAECGQFVDDDYRPEEGEIVRECEVCAEKNETNIIIHTKAGETTVWLRGKKVKLG